jgi:hypothetical protein
MRDKWLPKNLYKGGFIMKELIPRDEYGVFADTRDVARVDNLVHEALHLSSTNLEHSLQLIEQAFLDCKCPWIKECVRETVMHWWLQARPTERDVYQWFLQHYKEKLGSSWQIVHKKNSPLHIPDFWISNGHLTIPVECKLHDFNTRALKQLQRYMAYYNCDNGIAVAATLTTILPSNIKFINFDIDALSCDGEQNAEL